MHWKPGPACSDLIEHRSDGWLVGWPGGEAGAPLELGGLAAAGVPGPLWPQRLGHALGQGGPPPRPPGEDLVLEQPETSLTATPA
eukprot:scaffold24673_cov43-Prasinocladus_malaysianus.AAC.1